MKTTLLSAAVLIVFATSCGTVYEAGQTPDDVYYSPANGVNKKELEREEEVKEQYERYTEVQEDRFLRLKLNNRFRFNCIDDFSYWNDSRFDFMGSRFNNNFNNFRYNFNCGCMNGFDQWSGFNPAFGFNPVFGFGPNVGLGYGWGNGFRNPISSVIAFKNPRMNIGGGAGSNVTAFKNKTYGNVNLGYRNPKTGAFETGNNGNSFGNLVKRVFSTATTVAGAVNNNSWDRASRSFSNSNNSAPAMPSSNAGGNSGGVKSAGSSTSTGRGGRDN
jgi:hypothetical protein